MGNVEQIRPGESEGDAHHQERQHDSDRARWRSPCDEAADGGEHDEVVGPNDTEDPRWWLPGGFRERLVPRGFGVDPDS